MPWRLRTSMNFESGPPTPGTNPATLRSTFPSLIFLNRFGMRNENGSPASMYSRMNAIVLSFRFGVRLGGRRFRVTVAAPGSAGERGAESRAAESAQRSGGGRVPRGRRKRSHRPRRLLIPLRSALGGGGATHPLAHLVVNGGLLGLQHADSGAQAPHLVLEVTEPVVRVERLSFTTTEQHAGRVALGFVKRSVKQSRGPRRAP